MVVSAWYKFAHDCLFGVFLVKLPASNNISNVFQFNTLT